MNITVNQHQYPFEAWRPEHGRVFDFFAFDTETTAIDDEHPNITPSFVLGAACDAQRGVFIARDRLGAFFAAHAGVPFVCHYAAFDLRVTDLVLKPLIDIYQAVDGNLVWDTLVLNRLLSLATHGHTARGESSLDACALNHLGVTLPKLQTHDKQSVRTSFGQFLGKSPAMIPEIHLNYLASDVVATFHLYVSLQHKIVAVLQASAGAFGFVDHAWMANVYQRFGPLTHHIQIRASIVMDAINVTGIGVDAERRDEKIRSLQAVRDDCQERLRVRGYLPGNGSQKAIQAIIRQCVSQHFDVELKQTESGKRYSTTEEDLMPLAELDPFFRDYFVFRHAEKLLATYLKKMNVRRLYPRFGFLVASGRTFCGGGFNLQNLPKEKALLDADPSAATVRGVFVPAPGHVFIDSDLSQIELVVLAYVWKEQLRLGSALHDLINAGNDVHKMIAAAVLNKPVEEVTKNERNSVKPVSFGMPGGMAPLTLQKIAKNNYGLDLDLHEVENRMGAYAQLCPELVRHLTDEVDSGSVIANWLNLTPFEFGLSQGRNSRHSTANETPAGWLGGMLLKVLRDPNPITTSGTAREYTLAEKSFFLERAQQLATILPPHLQHALRAHEPSEDLWKAVRDKVGRRPVFTLTGRLRANTTFCASRNCLFQGAAADGAILGLWRVWRAGHRIVAFIHDQIVVEAPLEKTLHVQIADVERHMISGMQEVIPGMRVNVESVVTNSLSKADCHSDQLPSNNLGPQPSASLGTTTAAIASA